MKLRELTQTEANPLDAMKTGAQKAAGAVKQAAGKVAGMAGGADKQTQQKAGMGAKMAANKMGAKGGTGGMMAKGLDKVAQGGALTGQLSKQIAPFAKQLTAILSDTTLRNKFMMLVKQAEKGAAPAESDVQELDTSLKGKEDYEAKKKALQDIQMDPNTSKDPDAADALKARLKRLEKDAEKQKINTESNDEADHIMQLAKLVSGASNTQQEQASDFANEMKALAGIKEVATAGATSAGNIASVANPAMAYGQRGRDSKGLPKAPQKKNADGTTVNALDMSNNLMGGKTVKRN